MKLNICDFRWTREPGAFTVSDDKIEIVTKPHTDLWQRTYYHFRNDNAPVFQMETEERFFSFVVKTSFEESHHRFDQCGIVMYLDSDNWLKGSIEYENEQFVAMYGMLTGTASTGIILLREIDGDFKTPAADNMVYQTLPAIVFGFPLMLLATLAPQKPVLSLIIMFAFFIVMNIILFRSFILGKLKRK